jgi:putative addiction module killer protein
VTPRVIEFVRHQLCPINQESTVLTGSAGSVQQGLAAPLVQLAHVAQVSYKIRMTQIRQTEHFTKWLRKMKDFSARAVIVRRIERLAKGNPGDVKHVGGKVSELRVDTGPGYRVYFTEVDGAVVILLIGGDKSSQKRNIAAAQELVKDI